MFEASMSIGRSGRVVPSATLHHRQFDDEILLLDLGAGFYYSLNAVGARMYQELISGKSPSEIAASLAPDYGLDAESLVTDCVALADDLLRHRLVKSPA
jgi:hypothetical protein